MTNEKLTELIGVKVTPSLHRAIEAKAKRMRVRFQDVVRSALAEYTRDVPQQVTAEKPAEPIAS